MCVRVYRYEIRGDGEGRTLTCVSNAVCVYIHVCVYVYIITKYEEMEKEGHFDLVILHYMYGYAYISEAVCAYIHVCVCVYMLQDLRR